MRITITGHTDIVGRFRYNTWLSRNRATAVKQYLIDNAIDEDRLKVVAMSYVKPAATNKTDKGRQLNRRVELVVIDK
jgi:outer membrane protein OmpA-like peptidoglycan-associated protein